MTPAATQTTPLTLTNLLADISRCHLCAEHLPLGPRPIVSAHQEAKLLIIGQAPGTRVHASGVPWDDPSGERLRQWLGLPSEVFYDTTQVAIMPMGFCYPGKGKSGDLPPRKECAPQWHAALLSQLPNIQLTLLIGQYAQRYYLDDGHKNLTVRVQHWREQLASDAHRLALPHPSPRNRHWLQKNPWFERELIPQLQKRIHQLL